MRLRKSFWILVMLAMPAFALAQETQQNQQKPPEKPAAETQKAPEQPAPTPPLTPAQKLRAQFPPAPKPGHPLDPADVDVLTGKNKPANPYGIYGARVVADPYSGFSYPMGTNLYGPTVYASPYGSTLTGAPIGFSEMDNRGFSILNGSRAGLPILFLNRGSHRRFVFLGRGLSFF